MVFFKYPWPWISNMPGEKEITIPAWIKTLSSGGYSRHLKWVWTSGFETYVSTILVSSKNKNKTKKKHKKWNELTPRYQTGETEVWAICTAPLLGTRNRQAPSGVHETLHSAGIAFFGQTAWGSNPHEGLRL